MDHDDFDFGDPNDDNDNLFDDNLFDDDDPATTTTTVAGGTSGGGASNLFDPHHHHLSDEDDTSAQPIPFYEWFPNAPPGTKPIITSCVAQAELPVPVDLCALSCGARNVEYLPNRRIVTATMRLREPRCVCIIRASGRIAIIGAVSPSAAKEGAQLCVRIIRRVLEIKSLTQFRFRIRSVAARLDLCHPIRLDALQREFPDVCAYEPETFCASVIKLQGPPHNQWRVSFSVFVSGKITTMGARSSAELDAAFRKLLPMLMKHCKR